MRHHWKTSFAVCLTRTPAPPTFIHCSEMYFCKEHVALTAGSVELYDVGLARFQVPDHSGGVLGARLWDHSAVGAVRFIAKFVFQRVFLKSKKKLLFLKKFIFVQTCAGAMRRDQRFRGIFENRKCVFLLGSNSLKMCWLCKVNREETALGVVYYQKRLTHAQT